MNWRSWYRCCVTSIAGSVLLFAAGCDQRDFAAGPQAGDRFPEMRLNGLMDGKPFSTASLRGTVLLVNFWATWCEPCREEMPSLETLSHRFDPRELVVLGVSLDADLNLAREFVLKHKLSFSNFSDRGSDVARDMLHIRVLPETLVVAPDGIVAARIRGARDWAGQEAGALLGAVMRGEPAAAFQVPR